jgi:hypothetical protein
MRCERRETSASTWPRGRVMPPPSAMTRSYEVGADGMPWADDAHQLLDAVATDNLGEQLLGDGLARRAQQCQEEAAPARTP